MSEPQTATRPIDPYLQPLPTQPAHRIQSDAEAIEIARALAADFAREAAQRDRERRLPVDELNAFSQSGLWGITVPKAYGGAEVSYRTVAEVIKTIAAADPSLAQLPQNHLVIVDHIRQMCPAEAGAPLPCSAGFKSADWTRVKGLAAR